MWPIFYRESSFNSHLHTLMCCTAVWDRGFLSRCEHNACARRAMCLTPSMRWGQQEVVALLKGRKNDGAIANPPTPPPPLCCTANPTLHFCFPPDERDRVQKKTFTKWVNKHLIKVRKHITDLYEDLRDGHNLISLLEVLSGVTLVSRPRLEPSDTPRAHSAQHRAAKLAPLVMSSQIILL
ncbi:hypothetical protein Z043_110558 [Scleropages formosus]|uniref:Calponin-homology (CH) domain-containing protein n=1 Tax=Scleropages formosus TaxID=113540 RepID=A0A0P7UNP0_SCLFO|nr:hypothetical protein Z043_110558 [Scleropages formosus]